MMEMFLFFKRLLGTKINQVRITILDADDFDSFFKKAAEAAEITALAAGAGPPAKRIPTRLKRCSVRGGGESVLDIEFRNDQTKMMTIQDF